VLSNPELKGVFDKYGEFGLKNGVTDHEGKKMGGYIFLGNSEEIFENFFNSYSPLEEDFNLDGSDMYPSFLRDAYGGLN
jgi:DnaJ family protein B protein 4